MSATLETRTGSPHQADGPRPDRTAGSATPAREVVRLLQARGRRRMALALGGLALALLGMVAVRVLLGQFTVTLPDVVRILGGEQIPGATYVVMESKLPRAVGAVAAGAAFGAAGALFRRTLRNPLASPDLIGVSGGAAAGAVTALAVFDASGLGMAAGALVGGLAASALVLAFARAGSDGAGGATSAMGGEKVIVAGIAIAALAQVIVAQIVLGLDRWNLQTVAIWTSGSLNIATWERVSWITVALAVLGPVAAVLHQRLAPADLGADFAHGLGAEPERTGFWALVVGALLASIATAAFGPLAFVALLATPLARGLTGGRPSIIASALVGALIVVIADFLAAETIPGLRLPTGILTGAAGAPLMLWLLIRSRRGV
ncbi:MAG: iron ABC transporter permease [Brachybacterium sp.]|nr:iron ABC transporter permease [Brachybacterium sp.]